MTGATQALSAHAAGTRFDELPDAVIDAAQRCIVDTVGVMIAGTGTDTSALVGRFGAARGVTRLPGHPLLRTGAPDILALTYGTDGHALDFDDGLPGAVHPSVPVLAAIIAARQPLSSQQLIEAFVAGWETVARVTRALGPGHYRRGWHTTGTAATFGATAAACRLACLEAGQTATAFGIAGSMAAGLQRNFGTMTKPLHSGSASRNGVVAAELAAAGFTAASDVLDGTGGFLEMYGGGDSRPDLLERPWNPYALVDPGAIVKAYPCCYASARAVDAMLRLRPGIDPASVESIECAGPVGAFRALRYPRPLTGLQGKFSLEYAVAAALLDGTPTLASFTDHAVSRPAARALVERTSVREEGRCRPADPTGAHSSPATGGFVDLTVRLADGTTLTARTAEPHGSPADPLSWPEIEAKFYGCLSSAGAAPTAAAELLRRLRSYAHADAFGHDGGLGQPPDMPALGAPTVSEVPGASCGHLLRP